MVVLVIAGNRNMHLSLDEFKFWQDSTTDCGVSCPWAFWKSTYKLVSTLVPSFLTGYSSLLQVTTTAIKSSNKPSRSPDSWVSCPWMWEKMPLNLKCEKCCDHFCAFISSPEPTAHRWAYRILMVQRTSVVRPSSVRPSRPSLTISNFFFSETAWPIKAKFYVEPPWVGGTIFCSRHLGHMTKMAAMPIYGKNPSKIFFSRTGRRISTKLGM